MIEPAGLMWSVVTESPTAPGSARRGSAGSATAAGLQVDEERRLLDVGAALVPVGRARRSARRSRCHSAEPCERRCAYWLDELLARDATTGSCSATSAWLGQMSCRKTGLPSLSGAERLGRQVDVDRAGDRVRDDQRRRGEIVRLHVRIDAALEVAIAREHRGDDEIVPSRPPVAIGSGSGPRVADARRAAVADGVEAERVEICLQARLVEIIGDDREPGASDVFTHGLRVSPCATAFRASRPARDHHRRVADVFVQLVIAAMTTAPCGELRRLRRRARLRRGAGSPASVMLRHCGRNSVASDVRDRWRHLRPSSLDERHAILRPLRARPATARPSPGRVRALLVNIGLAASSRQTALLLVVPLDEIDRASHRGR